MENYVAGSGAPVSRQFWRSALRIGAIIATVRISVLWYLIYREWTGTQSLSHVLLVFFLLPEGFIFPRGWSLTAAHVWLLSGILLVGTLTIVMFVAYLIQDDVLPDKKSR
jgi:hypothetical protein